MQTQNTMQTPDRRLVRRAQQGEKSAFDFLVLKYEPRLSNAVLTYTRNPSDVPDILQETFFRAYRALSGFRGESAFYTWLYRIAINTARNYAAWHRSPGHGGADTVLGAEGEEGGVLSASEPAPDACLATDEMAAVLSRTFAELPESLRTALALRELRGLSYKQIADLTGAPIGTVRSRIFRARSVVDRRLRPFLH